MQVGSGLRRCRPREALAAVNETEPQIALLLDANYVAAVIKLRGYDNTYLYVARLLDPRVVAQLRATQASVSEYAESEARRLGVQIAFALMYTVIALIVLLSAVWIGLELRQPAGRADPPADRRGQHRVDRQSLRAGAGAARRRAISPSSARPSTG